MNWLEHISAVTNSFNLATFYSIHVFNEKVKLFMCDTVVILGIHGFYIAFLTRLFQRLVGGAFIKKNTKYLFPIYLVAVFLVLLTHVGDIFIFACILDSLKVFADPLRAFYFVGGMYTTVGYGDYTLPTEWQALPLIISFCGLFAFSMSGASLYTMLGSFLKSPAEQPKGGAALKE